MKEKEKSSQLARENDSQAAIITNLRGSLDREIPANSQLVPQLVEQPAKISKKETVERWELVDAPPSVLRAINGNSFFRLRSKEVEYSADPKMDLDDVTLRSSEA